MEHLEKYVLPVSCGSNVRETRLFEFWVTHTITAIPANFYLRFLLSVKVVVSIVYFLDVKCNFVYFLYMMRLPPVHSHKVYFQFFIAISIY